MKLIPARCPNCGASVDLDASQKAAFCIHCGTRLLVDDEVERIEITTDRTKEMNNILLLADNAFLAKNYDEAYTYYTRYMEYNANVPRVVFRRGLCAAYLSDTGELRIPELVTALNRAAGMAQAKGDEQSILRFVAEVRIYVQQYYGPLFTYGRKTRFDTRAALLLYLDQTIQFARLLDQLLPYIPYERMKRNPSSQQLKREVVLLALDLYTRATQQYIYISGQHIASGHVVADLAHYRSPDAQVCQASVKRLNAEYNNIPYVNDTLYQMDQEIAKLDAGAGEYNTLCARFWQEHPDLYAQYQDIPIFGRKKKQDAFKQEHFPPQLFEAEQRSLDQQLRAAQLRLKRKEFLEKNTR